ncbi:hypothetical protein CRX53_09140 [Leclercia adecarboxylata]|uniref:Uncharacterized protein n=1 Tax=Leclercia adecarboxylata TaxID=83655 RepID=A0A855EQS1_9ENTR|nr:hypothetical protein CRX53_09140 [Leclercia adecarboxylata]
MKLFQSNFLKYAVKVMANAADMFLTCVMNAGLITKLRELCPLPCGLFFYPELFAETADDNYG